ncbi:MAG: hypothetical protein IT379_11950 [Deltaproteobacteria bacterium]|nr:hypothetical protein [Deltaproteobacteria bacterium]
MRHLAVTLALVAACVRPPNPAYAPSTAPPENVRVRIERGVLAEGYWEHRVFIGVLRRGQDRYEEAAPEVIDDNTLEIAIPPEQLQVRLIYEDRNYVRVVRLLRDVELDAHDDSSFTCTHALPDAQLRCREERRAPSATPARHDGCASDTECPDDGVCEHGACVQAGDGAVPETAPTRSPEVESAECRLNSDCQMGQVCRAGRCVVECREDRDCEPGNLCDGYGRCVPETR